MEDSLNRRKKLTPENETRFQSNLGKLKPLIQDMHA